MVSGPATTICLSPDNMLKNKYLHQKHRPPRRPAAKILLGFAISQCLGNQTSTYIRTNPPYPSYPHPFLSLIKYTPLLYPATDNSASCPRPSIIVTALPNALHKRIRNDSFPPPCPVYRTTVTSLSIITPWPISR